MITEIGKILCEATKSLCCIEDEGEFLTYGMRAVLDDGTVIYEFEDISPDREKVECFVQRLNDEQIPATSLHYAIMDFLQAM